MFYLWKTNRTSLGKISRKITRGNDGKENLKKAVILKTDAVDMIKNNQSVEDKTLNELGLKDIVY